MRRTVMIHGIEDARAALADARAACVSVTLVSAPGAAGYAGAAWFREVVALARAEYPDVAVDAVLDCGDAPGHALAALRAGIQTICFTGDEAIAAKLAEIAAASGARLLRRPPAASDPRFSPLT